MRLTWRTTLAGLLCLPVAVLAHNISDSNAQFVEALVGPAIVPFLYLGAKHMVTGYDHLLYLVGVVFFLSQPRDILLYVTLFAIGHSVTLLLGVLAGLNVNANLVDAIIGLSIVYKAFENLGGFQRLFGISPDTRVAVFVFGLCHGLGLATKLQEIALSDDGLLTNMISFNLGVELGQMLALTFILLLLLPWRQSGHFAGQAYAANSLLMVAGFILAGYQLAGYYL
ncbi:MAG: HupE/UreJ family protein [Pseudomonadota bacterium]